MKILIIGSGGRENALAWKFSQSPRASKIFVWPGNPSTDYISKSTSVPNTKLDFLEISRFCRRENIRFVFCGPEKPLEDGLVDYLGKENIPVFGPTKAAALLETSKAYAKEIMKEAEIPTAHYEIVNGFSNLFEKANDFLQKYSGVVIKASALASGKGVFICKNNAEIKDAVETLEKYMQSAAEICVLEEILVGREASYFLFIGKNLQEDIGFAVDHKRLKENNLGPNTGGMGAYTPVTWLPQDASKIIQNSIVSPLLNALCERNINYTGCLYVGLMWTDTGPKVIEYNVRLGDPETQALIFADEKDWFVMIEKLLDLETIDEKPIYKKYFAKSIVLASEGYPYSAPTEDQPEVERDFFKDKDADSRIFGASIVEVNGVKKLGAGRVLNVVVRGESFAECDAKIKAKVTEIEKTWKNFQWRSDI